jgi:hypothetical protein
MRTSFELKLFLSSILLSGKFLICISCPFEAIVKPFGCECDYGEHEKWLSCQSEHFSTVIDLLTDNMTANQTYFDELYLKSDTLEEIRENFLRNISFKVITFHNCSLLRNIHKNAFKNIELNIEKFEIIGQNLLEDENVFEVISGMANLRSLRLSDTKLSSIPENAFNPTNGLQRNLTRISFDSYCSHSPIKRVMKHAFYHLPNLIHLDLSCLQLEQIVSDAFQFIDSSNPRKLFIDLSENQLTENSFGENFLKGINRNVELILNYNPFIFLNETIFAAFLDSNSENSLKIWQNVNNSRVDCDSCLMNWLKTFDQRVGDTICSDGKPFKMNRKSLLECPIYQNRRINCND